MSRGFTLSAIASMGMLATVTGLGYRLMTTARITTAPTPPTALAAVPVQPVQLSLGDQFPRARQYRQAQAKIHFTTFSGGSKRDKVVALTFDDGPDPVVTPKILDVLKKYHAPATFFEIGLKVERYPDIVRREAREGHDFGNHTYHHLELTEMREDGVRFEIERTNQALEKVVGGPTRWFRAPGCHYTEDSVRAIDGERMVRVDSTDNTGDWAHPKPDQIVRRALLNLAPGNVILCHDRISETAEALPRILETLKQRGYRVISLAELAQRAQSTPGFQPQEWVRTQGVQAPRMVASTKPARRVKPAASAVTL